MSAGGCLTRAIVLSGGGPVGIAWETAIVGSLIGSGIDLAAADLVVGTSAGSVVGVQIALGIDMAAAAARYKDPVPPPARPVPPAQPAATGAPSEYANPVVALFAADLAHEERLVAIGRLALDANTIPESQYLDGFRRLRLPWPRGFVCTAVDAESGEFVGWDAESGVDLALAIASSCAVPRTSPPVTIDGRRYIDGGMRSLTNADLSRGYDRVLVVTVLGTDLHESDDPRVRFRRIATDNEVQSLRDAGARVELLVPNEAAAAAIGVSLMDASNAPGAGHAGVGQGAAEVERLRAFWG